MGKGMPQMWREEGQLRSTLLPASLAGSLEGFEVAQSNSCSEDDAKWWLDAKNNSGFQDLPNGGRWFY